MKSLSKILLKLASQDPEFRKTLIKVAMGDRKPGQAWDTHSVADKFKRFRGMNRQGLVFGFRTMEEAQNYASGKEDPFKIKEWDQIVEYATDGFGNIDWEDIDDSGSRDQFEEDWGPLAKE